MNEDLIFIKRNRVKNEFVNTSKVLLYCYKQLSDAAKITFQIIDGFDWESKETGDSKGYVFPAVDTIARLRNISARTIRRHIVELIKVKLLTRIRRRNKASILYIEDVSKEEEQKYFDLINPKAPSQPVQLEKEDRQKSRTDKNVHSEKAGERTKMSIAYMKENEKKENEINVNANFKKSDEKKRHGMQGMKDIMKRFDTVQPPPVPENKIPKKSPAKRKPEEKIKRDYFAEQIATELQDEKSLGCYRIIAEKVPQPIIFETLGSVKELWREGKIKKSRGALFVDIIKQYCNKKHIDLAFSEQAGISISAL